MSRRSAETSGARDSVTARSPANRLARMARCHSRSVCMRGLASCNLNEPIGTTRLIDERLQWRNVVVPFDQGWDRPEQRERLLVQRPDFRDDARAVIVDTQGLAIAELPHRVPGKVDFADRR